MDNEKFNDYESKYNEILNKYEYEKKLNENLIEQNGLLKKQIKKVWIQSTVLILASGIAFAVFAGTMINKEDERRELAPDFQLAEVIDYNQIERIVTENNEDIETIVENKVNQGLQGKLEVADGKRNESSNLSASSNNGSGDGAAAGINSKSETSDKLVEWRDDINETGTKLGEKFKSFVSNADEKLNGAE